jgi:hypothetical protein
LFELPRVAGTDAEFESVELAELASNLDAARSHVGGGVVERVSRLYPREVRLFLRNNTRRGSREHGHGHKQYAECDYTHNKTSAIR